METWQTASRECPVGVFDSGMGGISVLRELRAQLPGKTSFIMGIRRTPPMAPNLRRK